LFIEESGVVILASYLLESSRVERFGVPPGRARVSTVPAAGTLAGSQRGNDALACHGFRAERHGRSALGSVTFTPGFWVVVGVGHRVHAVV